VSPPIASSTASKGAHSLREIGVAVIHAVVGAEPAQPVVAGGRRRGRDMGAQSLGELDRQVADAAAAGVDQHPLAGADAQHLGQALPGRQPGQRHRRGLREIHALGYPRQVFRPRKDEFGKRAHARLVQPRRHPVADAEAGCSGPSAVTTPAASLPRIAGMR
jgi:hypothetical protein